jgi:ferredoxin-nitrite reductase
LRKTAVEVDDRCAIRGLRSELSAMSELNPVEVWKSRRHGFDVWSDFLHWAEHEIPFNEIDEADLQRLKWFGIFWRKHDHDRYMLRVRIPGCEMTAEQARVLAFIAYSSGHEIVDLTTRGNIQIQGLPIGKIPRAIQAMDSVGLTSKQTGLDNVRNVTCHPLSGIDPAELIDTREAARAVTALFIDSRDLADLPRKFNLAFSGVPYTTPQDWTQDIAWLAACGPDSTVGYRLLIGGMQGQSPHLGWHVPVFVRPGLVIEVTLRILQLFRERGSRSARRNQVRFRYLIDALGLDEVLRELETRLGYTLERWEDAPPLPGRTESFVGWFRQRQPGKWAVGIAAPMGRLGWQQLEGIALIARNFGDGTIRTATDQNLLLVGVSEESRELLGAELARYGLSFEADSLTRQTVACTGKQFCSLALTETKGYSFQLLEELRRRRLESYGVRIAVSGCANACAQHHTADIGLKGVRIRQGLGAVDGFDIFLGGGIGKALRLGVLYRRGVPVSSLAVTIDTVVREFHEKRHEAESFSEFWQRRLTDHSQEIVSSAEVPVWCCAACGCEQTGDSPPSFCPRCAAVKRQFSIKNLAAGQACLGNG